MRAILPLFFLAFAAGCKGKETDTLILLPGYYVDWSTDPAPPTAGEEAEVWLTVRDIAKDEPVFPLQTSHTRVVHTFIISRDLTSFVHLHHEDFAEVSADDLINATFHYPYTFPYSGEFTLAFDTAFDNAWISDFDNKVQVGGDVPQLAEPELDFAETTSEDQGVKVDIEWTVPPEAGETAEWTIHLTEGGEPVTDIVQYLGADAHCAVVKSDLTSVGHTHAWYEGMEAVSPGMVMEPRYDGPDIPFKYAFRQGDYRLWIQFTREVDPTRVYTVSFDVEVPPS